MKCFVWLATFIFFITGSSFILAQDAVTSATKHADKTCQTIVQYSDPKTAIKARVGVNFQIALVSNPTTGYSWGIDDSALNGGFVRLISSAFLPSDTKMAGASGQQVWVFQPLKPGSYEIRFEYSRKWEKGVPAIDEKVFKVKIKK